MDESSVRFFNEGGNGTVFVHRQAETWASVLGATNAKGYTTDLSGPHCSGVRRRCDSTALAANHCREHEHSPRKQFQLIIESPPNARLVRRPTCWNTTALQEEVIGWLREALEHAKDDHTLVLLMDAEPAHLASDVFRACANSGKHTIVASA